MKLISLFAAIVLSLTVIPSANAEYSFKVFSNTPGADLNNVAVGQSVSANLFVFSNGGLPTFNTLSSFGFDLTGSGSGITISSWTPNSSFTGTAAAPAGTAIQQSSILYNLGGIAPVDGLVNIGELVFTANSVGTVNF